MNIKLFGIASVLTVAFFIPSTSFAVAPQITISAEIIAELTQQIQALQLQIEELKADLANTNKELSVMKEELLITKTLQRGMVGEEVKKLQEFLSMMPDVYPEGLVTGYFGLLTEKAVKKWQEENDIEGVGIVGPLTRAKLSEVTATNSSTVTPATPAIPTSESGVATVPAVPAQSNTDHSAVTPAGTIPATPAVPNSGGGGATSAIPATPANADVAAPIISNIQATNITQTTAVISWTTNEVSTSDVYYARNSSVLTNGTLHASVAGNVTSHSITLSNLVTYSGYYYLVVSRDEAGNTSTSSVNQFLSLMEPVVTPTTRTITATAGTGGTISPDGSVVVTQGTNKIFTVIPNTGYTISAVMVDGVNQGAIGTYTFTNVQTTHTISATFAQVTYAITVTQGANGTISPGTSSVVSGGGQAFTIAPATGYQIASVSVDGVNQGAISTYTFTSVQASHTITATFSLIPVTQSCTLTVSIAASTPAAQNINPGQGGVTLVKFNATPNCNGTLNSFAVSLLPMPNGYQNISTLRLYNDTTGVQLGSTQSVTIAGMNFPSVNAPLTANQTLVLRVVGDVSSSAIIGGTVYGTFGGSYGVTSSGGTIGNNASGNLIMGNTMTVVAGSSNPPLGNSQPPVPSTPTPTSYSYSASVGTPYTYTTMIYPDTDGNQVMATFDWGDGMTSNSSLVTPVSGQSFSSTHSWSTNGVFSVKAKEVDSTGLSSAWSSAAIITVTDAVPPAGFSMSSALPSTNLYSGFLSFSWTPRNDVAGYRIYLTNTATNVTTTLNFSPASQSGVGNFGYDQGVQYSAYIVSVDAGGNISASSPTLYATTLKLTKPTNFTASAASPTSVSLAWTASEGIIYKYMITRYTGSVGNAQNIVEVLSPATSYVDTTVAPGLTYIYWIKSVSIENYGSMNVGAPTLTTPAS